jgi:peptidoglycan biosynthesis protein MviN/MurJ (putative lipid II flippase)
VKAYGTWRNLYATGMAERIAGEQLAGRAGLALRVAGALTAVVSGVVGAMDVVDSNESRHRKQWGLMILQAGSGLVGIASAGTAFWAAVAVEGGATIVAGLSLTGWGLLLAVVLVALAMAIDHSKDDPFAQWMERCYWGRLPSGRYTDPGTERSDFSQLMAGA